MVEAGDERAQRAHAVGPVAPGAIGQRLGVGGRAPGDRGRGVQRGVCGSVHVAGGLQEGDGGPHLVVADRGPGGHPAHLHAVVEDPEEVARVPACDGAGDVRRLRPHAPDGRGLHLARRAVALPAGGVEMARAQADAGGVHQVRRHRVLGRRAQADRLAVGRVQRPARRRQVVAVGGDVVEAEGHGRAAGERGEDRQPDRGFGMGVALEPFGTAQDAGPFHAAAPPVERAAGQGRGRRSGSRA